MTHQSHTLGSSQSLDSDTEGQIQSPLLSFHLPRAARSLTLRDLSILNILQSNSPAPSGRKHPQVNQSKESLGLRKQHLNSYFHFPIEVSSEKLYLLLPSQAPLTYMS